MGRESFFVHFRKERRHTGADLRAQSVRTREEPGSVRACSAREGQGSGEATEVERGLERHTTVSSSRRSSVVVLDSACHAGDRGFKSWADSLPPEQISIMQMGTQRGLT